MANETIVKRSAYGVCVASDNVLTTAYSDATRTPVASIAAITTTEKDYPTLDFKLVIDAATGAVSDNDVVNLYRIASDSSGHDEPLASAYNGHYVGSFVLEAGHDAGGYAYLYGVANIDPNDEFQWENTSGQTVDATLYVRTRSVGPAA